MSRLAKVYLVILVLLAAFMALLGAIVGGSGAGQFGQPPQALLRPVVALVALTAVVVVLMATSRNLAIARGRASVRYFRSYASDAPDERIERPARAYMNLLELPVLFYVVCALMLITGKFDGAQVALAWVFVAARCVHAFVHIAFNHVAMRFVAFAAGTFTLAVIWVRFALQNL